MSEPCHVTIGCKGTGDHVCESPYSVRPSSPSAFSKQTYREQLSHYFQTNHGLNMPSGKPKGDLHGR